MSEVKNDDPMGDRNSNASGMRREDLMSILFDFGKEDL